MNLKENFILFIEKLENDVSFRKNFENAESPKKAFQIAQPYVKEMSFNEFKSEMSAVIIKLFDNSKWENLSELESLYQNFDFVKFIDHNGNSKRISTLACIAILSFCITVSASENINQIVYCQNINASIVQQFNDNITTEITVIQPDSSNEMIFRKKENEILSENDMQYLIKEMQRNQTLMEARKIADEVEKKTKRILDVFGLGTHSVNVGYTTMRKAIEDYTADSNRIEEYLTTGNTEKGGEYPSAHLKKSLRIMYLYQKNLNEPINNITYRFKKYPNPFCLDITSPYDGKKICEGDIVSNKSFASTSQHLQFILTKNLSVNVKEELKHYVKICIIGSTGVPIADPKDPNYSNEAAANLDDKGAGQAEILYYPNSLFKVLKIENEKIKAPISCDSVILLQISFDQLNDDTKIKDLLTGADRDRESIEADHLDKDDGTAEELAFFLHPPKFSNMFKHTLEKIESIDLQEDCCGKLSKSDQILKEIKDSLALVSSSIKNFQLTWIFSNIECKKFIDKFEENCRYLNQFCIEYNKITKLKGVNKLDIDEVFSLSEKLLAVKTEENFLKWLGDITKIDEAFEPLSSTK